MTRPFYETGDQRLVEHEVAEKLAYKWHATQVAFPDGSTVDRVLVRDGRVIGLVEIKTRQTPVDKYPTYYASHQRLQRLRYIAKALRLPPVFVVQWSDACGWLNPAETKPVRIDVGGRVDRGDQFDVELVEHYPTNLFRSLW